jgi:hypothetical protein
VVELLSTALVLGVAVLTAAIAGLVVYRLYKGQS